MKKIQLVVRKGSSLAKVLRSIDLRELEAACNLTPAECWEKLAKMPAGPERARFKVLTFAARWANPPRKLGGLMRPALILIACLTLTGCASLPGKVRDGFMGFLYSQSGMQAQDERWRISKEVNRLRYQSPECVEEVASALVYPMGAKLSDACAGHYVRIAHAEVTWRSR
jgi:hypothetical protein